jgi:hypothetical protein
MEKMINSQTLDKNSLLHHLEQGVRIFQDCIFVDKDLSGLDIKGPADFSGSNFSGSSLVSTRFESCKMNGCNFQGANLSHATIVGGSWNNCDFFKTNLSDSTVLYVDAFNCFFGNTKICNANWIGVQICGSIIFSADLSGTSLAHLILDGVQEATLRLMERQTSRSTGLLSIQRAMANVIDGKSLDKTAENFSQRTRMLAEKHVNELSLRIFAGVDEITKFLTLTNLSGTDIDEFEKKCLKATNRPSVFLSYSTKDTDAMDKIHSLFSQTGISVWFAPKNIRAGGSISEQLWDAINEFTYIIPVLSLNSIKSDWVSREIIYAKHKEKRLGSKILYPVRIISYDDLASWSVVDPSEGVDYAKAVRDTLIPDFSVWRDGVALQNEFLKFARQLKIV